MHSGTEILSIGAAACFIASGLVLLRVHLLPTGLHWQVDAISDYGTGAYHRSYRALVVFPAGGPRADLRPRRALPLRREHRLAAHRRHAPRGPRRGRVASPARRSARW